MQDNVAAKHIVAVKSGFGSIMDTFSEVVQQKLSDTPCLTEEVERFMRVYANPTLLFRQEGLCPTRAYDFLRKALDQGLTEALQRAIFYRDARNRRMELPWSPWLVDLNEEMTTPFFDRTAFSDEEFFRIAQQFLRDQDLKFFVGGALADATYRSVVHQWIEATEPNAQHVLTGELKGPIMASLKEFVRKRTNVHRQVVICTYPDNKIHPVLKTYVAPIGPYGHLFAGSLVITTWLLTRWAQELADECREFAVNKPEVNKNLARFIFNLDHNIAPILTFQEGIQTLGYANSLIAAERIEGFDDPVQLIRTAADQGVLTAIGQKFPPAVIGPLGLTGSYIPDLMLWDGDRLTLNPDIMKEFKGIKHEFRVDKEEVLPSTGYGCPLAYPNGKRQSGIDILSRIFSGVLEVVFAEIESKYGRY